MMNCFPTVYEDELLYSCISRYRRMTGIVNKKALMKDLYNEKVSLNSVYFPVHCEQLINNLPINSKLTVDKLIKEHTLFRVFSSTLTEEKTLLIYNGMRKGKRFSPYVKFGLASSKIEMPNNLLYCPKCLEEDINKYGESYWRVLHQVVGVFYCKKHQIPLLKSNICSNDSRIDFVCLEDIDFSKSKPVIDGEFINVNLKYIELAEYLLKNHVPKKGKEFFRNIYIDLLRKKGFASKNGSLYIKELEQAFVDFYSNKYLKIMQNEVDLEDDNNWFRRFIRSSSRQKHILRHLLMIQFLGIDIEDLFETEEATGKKEYSYIPNPRLDLEIQRERWLQVLRDNPNLKKCEYKKIGKGLYSWLYKNDNEWFEKITPKKNKVDMQ
ncbi:TnsD family Tn7-like transposition protein [Clostridium sp. DL-VIII]|uniref:TnsD family Tn7-like transposition protein n=1 Tax=Clostridium sp. DL-VIII TaxID=641107 RepID=UPI000A0003F3|nr:TnsD family Tn7-like transposition protein [Clostridium sp. DL-VIII]